MIVASGLIKYFELIAGIIGVIAYYRNKGSFWFAFALYLVLLFGMEYTGYQLLKNGMYKQNTLLYKYVIIPSLFCAYHFLFYHLLKKHKLKVLISLGIFLVIALVENLLLSQQHYFSISMALAYGALAVVACSIVYLLNLVKTDEVLKFNTNMGFWFCIAILLFYVGSIVKLTFFNSLVFPKNSTIATFFNWIFIVLNYIMYFLFTIGFICNKPKQ